MEAIQLNHLTTTPPPTPQRLPSMLLCLQPYDVTIKYWLGKEMRIADALSILWPDE